MEGCETTNFVYGPKYSIQKYLFLIWLTSVLVCGRTSTISYRMFFKAILKILVFLETILKF